MSMNILLPAGALLRLKKVRINNSLLNQSSRFGSEASTLTNIMLCIINYEPRGFK